MIFLTHFLVRRIICNRAVMFWRFIRIYYVSDGKRQSHIYVPDAS